MKIQFRYIPLNNYTKIKMKENPFYTLFTLTLILAINVSVFSQKTVTPLKKMNKWGLVLMDQRIADFKYDTIQNSYNDYFIAKLQGKWGLLNKEGKTSISFKYDSMEDLLGGRYKVELDNTFGIVDLSGKLSTSLIYEDIDAIDRDSSILVKDNGAWYYMKNGTRIDKAHIVFQRPDQIATYGDCLHMIDEVLKKRCSIAQILSTISLHLDYPKEAVKYKVSGIVVVSFWISPEGKVEHKEILRDIGRGCGEASLDVIDHLDEWSPAIHEGQPVWSEFVIPIRFGLK